MSRVGGLVRGTGILAIAALTLSACGGTGFDQSSATKVIQSVDVNLDPAGAITEVASNAYLDELSGKSNSNTDDYSVEEVVEDLRFGSPRSTRRMMQRFEPRRPRRPYRSR